MSTPREERDDTQPTAPEAAAEKKHEDVKQDEPRGLRYLFKIAPADPKNSFDFEDVADK